MRMNDLEFGSWCSRLDLAEETVQRIQKIRTSPPERRVDGGDFSVSGTYWSRKMGFGIQWESHTVEFPVVYDLEFDDDVLEYYCQPKDPIRLEYKSANGRTVNARSTLDYFVLRRNRAGWEECKDSKQLPLLGDKQPNRFRLEDGRWVCPPGIETAKSYGLYFELRPSAQISDTFIRNANFLDEYLRMPTPVDANALAAGREVLEIKPTITLDELIASVSESVDEDQVFLSNLLQVRKAPPTP